MPWHSRLSRRPGILGALCALLALSVAWPAAARNLILNSGFEGPDTGGVPQNWAFRNWRLDELASGKVAQGGLVGPRCLQLSSPAFPADFCAYSRPVDVSEYAGGEFLLSCYYRTKDHPQAQITIATYAEAFAAREFETPELHSESYLLGETPRWDLVTWHISCMPESRELVVLLRIMGEGSVFFDGVGVQPVGAEVGVELAEAGTIIATAGTRSVVCNLQNHSQLARPIRLECEAWVSNRVVRRAAAECSLEPGEQKRLTATYPLDSRTAHQLRIRVLGREKDEVYQAYDRAVPGLVSARIVEPAFRSSVLATIPSEEIIVEGRLNASADLASGTEISAELVGTGARTQDLELLTDSGMGGPWRLRLPTQGMLTGKYEVQVRARPRGGAEHVLSLPLSRPPHADLEVAYDSRRRLWVQGKPMFPIGLTRVSRQEELAAVREAGANFVITPYRSVSYAYADTAHQAGLWVAVASGDLEGLFWRNLTTKYLSHPALLGWYGVERPDTQLVTPELLRDVYQKPVGADPAVADLDPYHPVILALRPNSTLERYAQACDIVLVWTDPIPRWPITTVADAVRMATAATAGAKPVWAMIQSTGLAWTETRGYDPETSGRPPTPAEHRAMVYLAVINGADGIAHYSFRVPPAQGRSGYYLQTDAADLWESIKETNRQLNALAPALINSRPEPLAASEGSPIRMAALVHEDARYVIAVNTSGVGSAVTLEVAASAGQQIPVLFEDRTLTASDKGSLADVFEPYAVHVYLTAGEVPAVEEAN